jgi:hypothetical protein
MQKIKGILNENKIVFLSFLLFVIVRSLGIGGDITNSDAIRWHRRSENFLQAIKVGDLRSTYQRYHPGVTLMWINSTVKQGAFTAQNALTNEPKTLEDSSWYPIIHGISKVTNILFYGLLFLLQCFIIKRLFGYKVSFLYSFILAIEPYFVGINRWFHLTSFEVMFSFSAFLLLLLWVKERKKYQLIFSSFLIGLGVLSKMSVLILGPLVGLIVVFYSFKRKEYFNVLIYPLIIILVFIALFPATWVDAPYVFNKLSSSLITSVADNLRDDMLSELIKPIYYIVILLLKLSPLVVILGVYGLIRTKKEDLYRIMVVGYFLVYFVLLTLSDQKIDRYSLSMFPPLILLAAIELSKLKKKTIYYLLGAQLIFFIFISVIYYPIYSAYYNPLLGGTRTSLNLGLYENSGEYYAQAAKYLKSKGRDIVVDVPNNIDSFKYYYNGNFPDNVNTKIDYVIESRDIDRIDVVAGTCSEVEMAFGPKLGPKIVYIFKCVKEK